MTDAPDPRDPSDEGADRAEPDRPRRPRRTGGRARRPDPGTGATGGDPGPPVRASGGGRRRPAPATRDGADQDGVGDDQTGPGTRPTGATADLGDAATTADHGDHADDERAATPGRQRRQRPAPTRKTSSSRTGRTRSTGSAPRTGAYEPAGTGDPAETYLAAYLDAVDRGDDPPDLDGLDPGARADVEAVLALLAGDGDAPAPGTTSGNPSDVPDVPDVPGAAGAAATTGTGVGSELRPLGESEFAVEHGLSRTNPDVVVSGPAVHQARAVAGMTAVDVAEEMARRGYAIEAEAVEALERRTAHRMHPRDARLLAAVLDLPLDTIEATAAPWPADPDALAELAGDGDSDGSSAVTPLVLGDDVVLRTGTGSHLGVLRCAGGADVLDSRTYRQAAATRLNGPWSHLAGALLVSDERPHLALAVDALDCVARQHAPSGLIGFSRLAEPETIAAALASYDRAYAIDWSDPDPLEGLATRPDQAARALAGRIETVAERLADEARRSRQVGKRPGYTAAAKWLRSTPVADVVALLDELAHADPDQARRRLDELTEVVLA